jgi:transcriptional regulator with XRE-family HTH domain
MPTAGEKLSSLRKSKGLTQEELSDLAKINLRTIQRIENGVTDPRSSTLKRICDVLKVDPGEIINAGKTENPDYLSFMHLSVIAILLIPSGNIILPLILWLLRKDKIIAVDEQGINILNFQIFWSLLILLAGIISISFHGGLIKLFYAMPVIIVVNLLYPIVVSILIKRGNIRNYYPVLIRFIK